MSRAWYHSIQNVQRYRSTAQCYDRLKNGQTANCKAETAAKIAAYFGVSVDYLLGNEEKEKPTAVKAVSDEELKFALFGDATVSDEDFEDEKSPCVNRR